MYHEFATDPKIQMLSEEDQRRYVMLLCLKCCNGDETLQDEEIAFQLRIDIENFRKSKEKFLKISLIDEHCQPLAWNTRQYVSDSSTERVARFRERQKEEKKNQCNVSVTPPDTDTDTEKDKNTVVFFRERFSEFWKLFSPEFGAKGSKKNAEAQFLKLRPDDDLFAVMCSAVAAQKSHQTAMRAKGEFVENFQHVERWIKNRRWEDELPSETTRPRVIGI
jgi:hypothetical protein